MRREAYEAVQKATNQRDAPVTLPASALVVLIDSSFLPDHIRRSYTSKVVDCIENPQPASGYLDTVRGIKEAGMTQLPAILSEAVEAALKAGCFIDRERLVQFVDRRTKEIEAGLGDDDLSREG